jgi:hypothetical protein
MCCIWWLPSSKTTSTPGDKVTRQAHVLQWPEVFAVDTVSGVELELALDRCLAPSVRKAALDCAGSARTALSDFSKQFAEALATPAGDRHLLGSTDE